MKYTHILKPQIWRFGWTSCLNMCDFEVNQPFVHYKVMIMYKVGLRGGTSFNIWYMAIIKWWIFHTVLLKIPAVMLLVWSFTTYIHTQTGSTISNDQSQDETHQNTRRKINVVPENHPVKMDHNTQQHNDTIPIQHDTHGQFPDNNNQWMDLFPERSLEMKLIFLITTISWRPEKLTRQWKIKTTILPKKNWKCVFPHPTKQMGEKCSHP